MVLRTLFGVAFFAICLPLACSSSGGDSDSTGGGGSGGSIGKGGGAGKGSGTSGSTSSAGKSSGGSDSSGGEPNGSSGADGGGGEPATPGGGGAPALECGENDTSISDCEVVGSVCQAVDRCCLCVDFPSAPSCGSLWDCAQPANNMEDCPENPPTPGSACTMINLSCQYCQDDGPHYLFCGIVQVGSDEGEWNEGDGISCNE